eukprot:864218-Pyramimonas_sp.AAC.1
MCRFGFQVNSSGLNEKPTGALANHPPPPEDPRRPPLPGGSQTRGVKRWPSDIQGSPVYLQ